MGPNATGLRCALVDRSIPWCEPLPAVVYLSRLFGCSLCWFYSWVSWSKSGNGQEQIKLSWSANSARESPPKIPVAQVPRLSHWHGLFCCTRSRNGVTPRKKPMNWNLFISSVCTSKIVMQLDKLSQVKMHSLAISFPLWWKLLEKLRVSIIKIC